jgi:anti-sigma regulatory factor (Ser/Thr protein kinase)
MSKVRARGEDVRKFILTNVEKHPSDITKLTAAHFEVTRQAVNKHLQNLVSEGVLLESGNTRNRAYTLCALNSWAHTFLKTDGLAEDVVWRDHILPEIGRLPENVLAIWRYGFTEIFNNALDHSEGTQIAVWVRKTAAFTDITITDNGIGIFKKIQSAMGLLDERHAILELSKGKLTTDPSNHSGEGIFFSSRMFDQFSIASGGVIFAHQFDDDEDWIMQPDDSLAGTTVFMKLDNHTARTDKKIFDQFTSGENYGFTKTVVPVQLAQYENDKLVSRSQAKRLLARVELFKTVIFDFASISSIGQAFADEIFRVFASRHPEIEIIEVHTSPEVKKMIGRAKAGLTTGSAVPGQGSPSSDNEQDIS